MAFDDVRAAYAEDKRRGKPLLISKAKVAQERRAALRVFSYGTTEQVEDFLINVAQLDPTSDEFERALIAWRLWREQQY